MKPILFNTERVRSILEGRKTVTRRAIRPQPEGRPIRMTENSCYPGCYAIEGTPRVIRPPCQSGDTLWVRETWQYAYDMDGNDQPIEETGRYLYAADGPEPFNYWIMPDGTHRDHMPWRPSIHMPREAARLFLRVTGVRVERLKDIDGHGILKEGIDNGKSNPAMGTRWGNMQSMAFAELWDNTVKPEDRATYGWEANPWVWVIEFERIGKDEALGGGGDAN